MLELRLLKYFVAVAQEEHIGRAAEKLCISASPLSRQIQKLEDRLGIALFDRENGRIRLTPEGESFSQSAEALLHHAKEVERQAHLMRDGLAGRIHIGYVEGALHTKLLQNALRRFGDMYPNVEIETRLLRSHAQTEEIRNGYLDLGFLYSLPNDLEGLNAQLLIEEPLVLAIPRDWSLANEPAITADHLQHCPVVGLPKSFHPDATKDLVLECRAGGWEPNIRYEASEPSTALELVDAGLGVALVQSSICQSRSKNVILRDLPWLRCAVRIYLMYSKTVSKAAVSQFLDMSGFRSSDEVVTPQASDIAVNRSEMLGKGNHHADIRL